MDLVRVRMGLFDDFLRKITRQDDRIKAGDLRSYGYKTIENWLDFHFYPFIKNHRSLFPCDFMCAY